MVVAVQGVGAVYACVYELPTAWYGVSGARDDGGLETSESEARSGAVYVLQERAWQASYRGRRRERARGDRQGVGNCHLSDDDTRVTGGATGQEGMHVVMQRRVLPPLLPCGGLPHTRSTVAYHHAHRPDPTPRPFVRDRASFALAAGTLSTNK